MPWSSEEHTVMKEFYNEAIPMVRLHIFHCESCSKKKKKSTFKMPPQEFYITPTTWIRNVKQYVFCSK